MSKRAKQVTSVIDLCATPHDKLRIVCNQLLAFAMVVDLDSFGFTEKFVFYAEQIQQYKRETEEWNARKREERSKCDTASS